VGPIRGNSAHRSHQIHLQGKESMRKRYAAKATKIGAQA
jgi:hypothetical protein